MPERWDAGALNKAIERRLIPAGSNYITPEKLEKWDYDLAVKKITEKTKKEYEKKREAYDAAAAEGIYRLPFKSFADWERTVLLAAVNTSWIDHIDAMDQLRKGIVLRAYAQSDPVIAYKVEGHQMFEEMVHRIQHYTVVRLLKTEWVFKKPAVPEAGEMMPSQASRAPAATTAPAADGKTVNGSDKAPMAATEGVTTNAVSAANAAQPLPFRAGQPSVQPMVDVSKLSTNLGTGPRQPVKAKAKVGPNDPCPCGSGKKYKKCCGKNN